MSSGGPEPAAGDAAGDAVRETTGQSDEARRRRRHRVFGEVLPDTTLDERDDGAGESGGSADDWLRSNVPPHHG